MSLKHADARLPGAMPTGTVTFLFTDIEGSTQLWERDRETMQQAVQRHDGLLREAIEAHGGFVFKTVGDAFCAAFNRPEDGLAAALAAQRRLRAGDLRVRMALHTGTAEERDGDYFGPALNRVARLLAIGHGGQVLLSAATAELEMTMLPADVQLRDLGSHRLKDLERPEHVYQTVTSDLPHEFPAPRSLRSLPHNLPLQVTSFVGREREVQEITDLLREHRIVTIVGAGGVGKTRASLQVGASELERHEEGVWFVDLAPLADATLIPRTIARTLSLHLPSGDDPVAALAKAMQRLRVLLILDNCEHLIDAAARIVAAITQGAEHVVVLATGRQALGIAGEALYRLPSLALEDAVRLFEMRAHAVDSHFALTDSNAEIVSDICETLDGIPLAIELAAARIKVLTPQQLCRRLSERLSVLAGGPRDALPRQQTMRAVIDWSYDLLNEAERTLLLRVSIFSGWTLEAEEAVCGDGRLDGSEILDLHSSLIEKSLVVADFTECAPRYRLLEVTRAYALEKLRESGEYDALALRHAQWTAQFAESAYEDYWATALENWLPPVRIEVDNVRAALSWTLTNGHNPVLGARIIGAMGGFWLQHGVLSEGRAWVDAALSVVSEAEQSETAARLYAALAVLSIGKPSAEAAQRALDLFAQRGDDRSVARNSISLAFAQMQMGELDAALEVTERALSLYRAGGMNRTWAYAYALNVRADTLTLLGRFDEARALFVESIALNEAVGDPLRAASARADFAELECASGNLAAAQELAERAAAALHDAGFARAEGITRTNAAAYELLLGRIEEAATQACAALLLSQRAQNAQMVTIDIQHLATIAALQGDVQRAARLSGYVDAWYRGQGYTRESTEQRTYDILTRALYERLSEPEIAQLRAHGEALSEDAAAAEALAITCHPDPSTSSGLRLVEGQR